MVGVAVVGEAVGAGVDVGIVFSSGAIQPLREHIMSRNTIMQATFLCALFNIENTLITSLAVTISFSILYDERMKLLEERDIFG